MKKLISNRSISYSKRVQISKEAEVKTHLKCNSRIVSILVRTFQNSKYNEYVQIILNTLWIL